MNGHFSDVRKYICRNQSTDSFAKYFAKFFDAKNNPPRCPTVRELCEFKILWSGNILNCMRDFGTDKCKLCMKERLEILRKHRKNPNLLINSCTEIYGSCRHKSRFHRYAQENHKESA